MRKNKVEEEESKQEAYTETNRRVRVMTERSTSRVRKRMRGEKRIATRSSYIILLQNKILLFTTAHFMIQSCNLAYMCYTLIRLMCEGGV